jgi:CDGSH-type Zn-finger protein
VARIAWRSGLFMVGGLFIARRPVPSGPPAVNFSDCRKAIGCGNSGTPSQATIWENDIQMSTTIRVRPNGPFLVEGPVTIIDSNGNVFPVNPDKPAVALCRCGQSTRRPFCDGTHNRCGFESAELAPAPETP